MRRNGDDVEVHASSRALSLIVVIVAYHSADVLPECLASLQQALGAIDATVIVVDNSSCQRTAEMCARTGVEAVAQSRNLGYGAAINSLSERFDSFDFLLTINPDTVFTEDAVAQLLGTAVRDDDIGAVGPRLIDRDGLDNDVPNGRRCVGPTAFAMHVLIKDLLRWHRNPFTNLYFRRGTRSESEPEHVDWLSGACLLIRCDAFKRAGCFNEQYFMYFEDVALCVQLARLALRNVYDPRAKVVHLNGRSSSSRSWVRARLEHARSAWRFYTRGDYADYKGLTKKIS